MLELVEMDMQDLLSQYDFEEDTPIIVVLLSAHSTVSPNGKTA